MQKKEKLRSAEKQEKNDPTNTLKLVIFIQTK